MSVDLALAERVNEIIDHCESLTTDAERAKALHALNHAIFLLTGNRPMAIPSQHEESKIVETRQDKRGCVSCKDRMIKAMTKGS